LITLQKIWHRGAYRIAAFFDKNDLQTRHKMKRIGARFSRTHRCWYLPYDKPSYKLFKDNFDNLSIAFKTETHKKQQLELTNENAQASAPKERLPRWIKTV
jgi:hypothetical protein